MMAINPLTAFYEYPNYCAVIVRSCSLFLLRPLQSPPICFHGSRMWISGRILYGPTVYVRPRVWLKDDGPHDMSVRVVKSVWYCKHIICYIIMQSPFVLVFCDAQTDREEAMLWSYVSCTKLSLVSSVGLYCNTEAYWHWTTGWTMVARDGLT